MLSKNCFPLLKSEGLSVHSVIPPVRMTRSGVLNRFQVLNGEGSEQELCFHGNFGGWRSRVRGFRAYSEASRPRYQVDVVELFWFGNHLPEQVDVVHKDIFDLSVQDLRGYEQVVFLAGLSNDPMAEFSPSKNFIFNAAAVSKLAGDGMVGLTWERSFVVRTCGLYGVAGSSGKGGNFVETMFAEGGREKSNSSRG